MNSDSLKKVSEQEIKNFLNSNAEWSVQGNFLQRTYPLKSYFKGLNFLQTIGWIAQKIQHHPELILTFSALTIKTTTHDLENSISNKDLEFATEVEKLWF